MYPPNPHAALGTMEFTKRLSRCRAGWCQVVLIVCSLVSVLGTAAGAPPLGKPTDKILLTISGSIKFTNGPGVATFDLPMLDRLTQRKSVVETPWTTGKVAFEGPLASSILDAVGASGSKVLVTALNDYTSEVPIEDFRKWPVILATRLNGKAIPVREKGPLFIIYPFDAYPNLYNELYFTRSVWQIKTLEIRK